MAKRLFTRMQELAKEADTIEDVYEPFLIQEGYMMRTAQGRVATQKAASRFGVEGPPPEQAQDKDEGRQPRLF